MSQPNTQGEKRRDKKQIILNKIRSYVSHKELKHISNTVLSIDDYLSKRNNQCSAVTRKGRRCLMRAVNGKRVCYLHGGKSEGQVTREGRRKALMNLPQYKNNPEALKRKLDELHPK